MARSRNEEGVTLLQSLSCEGRKGLLKGGYHAQMMADELIAYLQTLEGFAEADASNPMQLVGLGATAGLRGEMTYDGKKIYCISGNQETGEISTQEVPSDTQISFAQIGHWDEKKVQRKNIDALIGEVGQGDGVEVNRGGVFAKLTEQMPDKKQSYLLKITANVSYIQYRAVNPGDPLSNAADLGTMIKGGRVVIDAHQQPVKKLEEGEEYERNPGEQIVTIMPQVVGTQEHAPPKRITFLGNYTGSSLAENAPFNKGVLHIHENESGHILDLGPLTEVVIEYIPVAQIVTLLDHEGAVGKNKENILQTEGGAYDRHILLTKEEVDQHVIPAQRLAKAWLEQRHQEPAVAAL